MKQFVYFKKMFTSMIAMLLAFTVVFSCSVSVGASSVSELQEKIAAAKEKAEQLEEKAEAANETYQAKLDIYNTATEAVDTINDQITQLENKIAETEKTIKQLKIKIQKQQKAIDKRYNDFKVRLKALYIAGSLTNMQIILTSEDFSDYLTKLELVRQVSARDNEAIEEMQKIAEQMQKAKQKLDEDKQELEQHEKELEEDKKALVAAQEEAEKAYNESLTVLRKIKSQQENNNSQLAEYKEELNDVLAAIKKAEEEARKAREAEARGEQPETPSYPIVEGSGTFCYPVPGHTTITCGFYGYYNHNGVDFSDGSIYGANVVAVDAGTVIRVQYLTYSYGYHVFVYHGNGLTTQYCHLSAIGVSEGQTLAQGQYLGNVGSTGNSTGPHLHFGVFDSNGNFLNPESFF